MYVDIRLADIQAEYKREQLAKSYRRANRKAIEEKTHETLDGSPSWLDLWARLSLINR